VDVLDGQRVEVVPPFDDARWVTGETLEVNGGLFLGPTGAR
jgi:hypothetical protein